MITATDNVAGCAQTARGWLLHPLLLIGAIFAAASGLAQPASSEVGALASPSGDSARSLYTVEIGPAPQPGSEAVLTLLGPVREGAVVQWQRKGAADVAFVNLPETTTALRVNAVTMAMNGDQFRCVVTEATGVTVSSVATLLVGPPMLAIVDGNRQTTESGRFNPRPFDLAVWDAAGTRPLADTPVTFTVESGGGLLAASNTGALTPVPSLTLTTDADGTVQAFYRQPAAPNVASKIKALAGTQEVFFETTSLLAATNDAAGGAGSRDGGSTSAQAGANGKRPVVGSLMGLGVTTKGSVSGKSSTDQLRVAAMIVGLQVVVRGSANQYYSVDTGSWAITPTSGPP